MAEYIDRELAIKAVRNEDKDVMADYGEEYGTEWGFSEEKIIEIIMKVPAADVAPVLHGKWKYKEEWGRLVTNYCSICGQSLTTVYGKGKMNFCPNCGAKMDAK